MTADTTTTTKNEEEHHKNTTHPHEKEHALDLLHEEEMLGGAEETMPPAGCGILGRYPVLSVLLFALVGIGMGIGLSYWTPDDPESKKNALQWLGLIGDMFIRALKAVVLPLVFINVTVSVVEMMGLGRASSIGYLTIGLYILTTIFAATFGVISTLIFKGLYEQGNFDDDPPAQVTLGCNVAGTYLTELDDGNVQCTDTEPDSTDVKFFITDITKSFATNSGGGARDDISLSDTFYQGIFEKLITTNIFGSFVEANYAAVVIFAIIFGSALGRVFFRTGRDLDGSAVVGLFRELDATLLTILNWIMMVTPFAVWSLIIKAVGKQNELKDTFANVGFLVVCTMVAMLAQFAFTQCGLLALVLRKNPFSYLRHIVPAQTFAFASASSAATIPMTLRCVKKSAIVPDPVANFVVPLGATINMDGSAIYFPCACIWMAILNGLSPDAASYILLVIIATVGSAGTAPVPSASLVLIITAYNTVFNTTGTPEGFEYILAIDWFVDRLRTVMNVTGDSCVTAMVATISKYGKEEDDESSSEVIEVPAAEEEQA